MNSFSFHDLRVSVEIECTEYVRNFTLPYAETHLENVNLAGTGNIK